MPTFSEWLDKPLGKRLVELETNKLNSIVATLFGYEAVILGKEEFVTCLGNSPIRHKTVLNPEFVSKPRICSRIDKLPLLHEIVDLAYLPHCLEYVQNPHEVLREVYRVLRPDGHIIITMLNPVSLWGMLKPYSKANLISLVKLQDWLALLGFDIMRVNRFGFMLPLNRKKYSEDMSWSERCGQRFELPMAGAYVVQASKRIIPLNPITSIVPEKPKVLEVEDIAETT